MGRCESVCMHSSGCMSMCVCAAEKKPVGGWGAHIILHASSGWSLPRDYGTFCKATMEVAALRTHFHPLRLFVASIQQTLLCPCLATYQADTWSPRGALSKLNTPPSMLARKKKKHPHNVKIIKSGASMLASADSRKKTRHISESKLIKIMRVMRCFLPFPPPLSLSALPSSLIFVTLKQVLQTAESKSMMAQITLLLPNSPSIHDSQRRDHLEQRVPHKV